MNSLVQSQPEEKCYPIRTLRIFGGVQIGIGILSALLSVAGIVLDGITSSKNCDYYYWDDSYYYYKRCAAYFDVSAMFAFDIICLIFSGWFILTGAFPFCMSENRRNRWRCLKITFMVCCIVGSSIFIPTVFSLGIVGAIFRAGDSGGLAVLPSFVAFLGLVELVIAIVAASYCCCCSSWETRKHTRLVYVTPQQYGAIMSIPTTEISQTTAYPSGGGVMTQQYQVPTSQQDQVPTSQQYQVPPTQNIEAGAQQPPPYKQ